MAVYAAPTAGEVTPLKRSTTREWSWWRAHDRRRSMVAHEADCASGSAQTTAWEHWKMRKECPLRGGRPPPVQRSVACTCTCMSVLPPRSVAGSSTGPGRPVTPRSPWDGGPCWAFCRARRPASMGRPGAAAGALAGTLGGGCGPFGANGSGTVARARRRSPPPRVTRRVCAC
eukprot:gene18669-biopygen12974